MKKLVRYPEPIKKEDKYGKVYLCGIMASGNWRDEILLNELCGRYGRVIYVDTAREAA